MSVDKRVLIFTGLYKPGTGFTRVLQSLLPHLTATYEVHWLGIGYKGPSFEENNYTVHPNNLHGGDMYGAQGTRQLAVDHGASIVVLLADLWMLKNFADTLSPQGRSFLVAGYVPIDGLIPEQHSLPSFDYLDLLFAYTHFDQNQMLSRIRGRFNCAYFYHGVDTLQYHPIAHSKQERIELIRQTFSHADLEDDLLLVLNANRYNERKNLTGSLNAFALSLKSVDRQVILVLHTPGLPEIKLEEIRSEISSSGLTDRVWLNPLGNDYLSEEKLNVLYNCCEIGINTSFGEGWGMISFEHAASGGCQLIPDHPNQREIWPDALRYQITDSVSLDRNPLVLHQPSSTDLARRLRNLYEDQKLLHTGKTLSQDHVRSSRFSWKVIANKWVSTLKDLQV